MKIPAIIALTAGITLAVTAASLGITEYEEVKSPWHDGMHLAGEILGHKCHSAPTGVGLRELTCDDGTAVFMLPPAVSMASNPLLMTAVDQMHGDCPTSTISGTGVRDWKCQTSGTETILLDKGAAPDTLMRVGLDDAHGQCADKAGEGPSGGLLDKSCANGEEAVVIAKDATLPPLLQTGMDELHGNCPSMMVSDATNYGTWKCNAKTVVIHVYGTTPPAP